MRARALLFSCIFTALFATATDTDVAAAMNELNHGATVDLRGAMIQISSGALSGTYSIVFNLGDRIVAPAPGDSNCDKRDVPTDLAKTATFDSFAGSVSVVNTVGCSSDLEAMLPNNLVEHRAANLLSDSALDEKIHFDKVAPVEGLPLVDLSPLIVLQTLSFTNLSKAPSQFPASTLETLTGNHLSFAQYLNTLVDTAAINNLLQPLFSLTGVPLDQALTALSPLRMASIQLATLETQFTFSNLLLGHQNINRLLKTTNAALTSLATLKNWGGRLYASADDRFLFQNEEALPSFQCQQSYPCACANKVNEGFWVTGFGQSATLKARDTNPSFSSTAGSVLMGYDFFMKHWGLGTVVGYAHDWVKQAHDLGKASSNIYTLNFNATYISPDLCKDGTYLGSFYIDGALWGAYNHITNYRHIAIPTATVTTHSKSHSWTLTPHLDFGWDYNVNQIPCTPLNCSFNLTLEPFASFDWAINWASSIVENGGFLLDMTIAPQTSSFLKTELGINFYEQVPCYWGLFIARQTLAYVIKKPFSVGKMTAAVVGVPESFTLETFGSAQQCFSPEVELYWKWDNDFFFSATYIGEFGSGYSSNEGLAQIGMFF